MLQQFFTTLERKRTEFNGNVGRDRAALGLPTLSAVAHLNRFQFASDSEANSSAEARSLVFDAHTVFVLPNARGKLRRKERSDWREPKA
jgi:hypothetical protein